MSKLLTWEDNLIRDGFTQPAYIAGVDRMHGPCRFSFRPMLPEEVAELDLYVAQNFTEPRKAKARIAKECANRIVGWSEQVDGKELPITELNLRRLRPTLLTKIYDVISGSVPSDEDPELKDASDTPFVELSSLTESDIEGAMGKS